MGSTERTTRRGFLGMLCGGAAAATVVRPGIPAARRGLVMTVGGRPIEDVGDFVISVTIKDDGQMISDGSVADLVARIRALPECDLDRIYVAGSKWTWERHDP